MLYYSRIEQVPLDIFFSGMSCVTQTRSHYLVPRTPVVSVIQVIKSLSTEMRASLDGLQVPMNWDISKSRLDFINSSFILLLNVIFVFKLL